jgi:NNP family nitrate/nitrite transporter-like MFS transporter
MFVPMVAVMAVLFWLLARDAPGERPAGAVSARLAPFRRPMAWVLSLFYFVTFGGFVAISVYLPTYLVDSYGLTKSDAALRASGFVLVAVVARPLGGVLADRVGTATLLKGVFGVVAFLAIVLAFQPGMVLLTAAFLASAAALGLGSGAVFKLVPSLFPAETGDYAIALMLLSEFALGCLIINLLVLQRRAAVLLEDPVPAESRSTRP